MQGERDIGTAMAACRCRMHPLLKNLIRLCDDCKAHFEELKASLAAMGIAYTIDPMIVRGLDYYTKTVFEIISTEGQYKGTVCGGGR